MSKNSLIEIQLLKKCNNYLLPWFIWILWIFWCKPNIIAQGLYHSSIFKSLKSLENVNMHSVCALQYIIFDVVVFFGPLWPRPCWSWLADFLPKIRPICHGFSSFSRWFETKSSPQYVWKNRQHVYDGLEASLTIFCPGFYLSF